MGAASTTDFRYKPEVAAANAVGIVDILAASTHNSADTMELVPSHLFMVAVRSCSTTSIDCLDDIDSGNFVD